MLNILLVDDSKAVRMTARKYLSDLDGDVSIEEVTNGQEAVDLLRTRDDIDLMLLDWNMPVMDGITCLKTIRGDASLPQPRIVMCSTENEMERIMEALNSGANEYVMKPFTPEMLREKVTSVGQAS